MLDKVIEQCKLSPPPCPTRAGCCWDRFNSGQYRQAFSLVLLSLRESFPGKNPAAGAGGGAWGYRDILALHFVMNVMNVEYC